MSDYLGTIQCLYGFFPVSLSVVEVVLGSFARHSLHIHMRGYSMSVRGFAQFRFQWSRPSLGSFARHVDKHISDYLATIQC